MWTIQIELDATLSKKQMQFLTPRPCCCIPVQPQKIPHHLPQSSCTKPARPFRELLRSCLPSRSPVILVCSGLPRGRRWAQWRREPAPLQHCTNCCSGPHCHNTGWLLLSEISILFVSWVRLISLIMSGVFFPIPFIQPFFLVQNN